MHTLSAYVCTHVVLAFDVCLFGALGQVNFPPSLMNAFSSSCSCKRNSSPSLSVWQLAARAARVLMSGNAK